MAAKQDLDIKKKLAKMYYMQYKTNKEIAKLAGVSENTVGNWCKKEGWEQERGAKAITNKELARRNRIVISRLTERLESFEDSELIEKLPKILDMLCKYSKIMDKLDDGVTMETTIDVFDDYDSFLEKRQDWDKEMPVNFLSNSAKYQQIYVLEKYK
jgi:transposase